MLTLQLCCSAPAVLPQEAVKGSQGAGKVDEQLDRSHATGGDSGQEISIYSFSLFTAGGTVPASILGALLLGRSLGLQL